MFNPVTFCMYLSKFVRSNHKYFSGINRQTPINSYQCSTSDVRGVIKEYNAIVTISTKEMFNIKRFITMIVNLLECIQ